VDDNQQRDDDLDPDAPEFERLMMGEPEPDGVEHMEVNRQRTRVVTNALVGILNKLPAHVDGLMYLECLMGLSTVYGTIAERMLNECEFETWHEHRGKVLELVGIVSAYINTLHPTVAQLEEATVTETKH
jgi:hypothetical protein